MKSKYKNKETILNLTVQYFEKYSNTAPTAGIHGLTLSEQAKRVTDQRRELDVEITELKDYEKQEMGKL